ncbi:MAG: VanZ family protein [Acidobacteriota bacterium]
MRAVVLWGPVVLVAGAVAALSHMSRPPHPTNVPDWGLHALEFAVLGFTLARAACGGLGHRIGWYVAIFSISVASAYGAVDEVHQSFVPERDSSLQDVAADVAGATLGVLLALGASRMASRASRAGRRDEVVPLAVDLVTGVDCPLCDEAKTALLKLGRRLPIAVNELRIEDHPDLEVRHRLEIPVILIGGRKVSKGKVDPARLEASLVSRLAAPRP